jgi:hypothetical protein
MLFISPTNTKRFTLYHMEETEIYIQDFFGNCSFYDFASNEAKNKDKGKFYMCSKSLVYESDNKNIPLTKFKFESMKTLPTFCNQLVIQPPTPSSLPSAESQPSRWQGTARPNLLGSMRTSQSRSVTIW